MTIIGENSFTFSNLSSPLVKEFSPIIVIMLLVDISWSHTVDAALLILLSSLPAPVSIGISRVISSKSSPATPDAVLDAPRLESDAFLPESDAPPAGVDLPSVPPGADGFLGLLN